MLLKIGSTGEDVKHLQYRLGMSDTGQFGHITETKVKEWQTAHNLLADGIVGDITWNSLFPTVIAADARCDITKLASCLNSHLIKELTPVVNVKNLVTNLRLAHFLAQCATESNNFNTIYENLNYSRTGLLTVFPKYFDEHNVANYANNPEALANKVYANRMGNGDMDSGEG